PANQHVSFSSALSFCSECRLTSETAARHRPDVSLLSVNNATMAWSRISLCFKTEGGLNLPHIYTIKLSVDTVNGTFLAEWTMKLTQFDFNQKIDQAAFNIVAN